ncbi:MAG: serine/threonine-protein kinase [Verrucomicrobiota bacterium]|nr:serine/threonine-protein kinase [Verrucomicrobiota bacterium]
MKEDWQRAEEIFFDALEHDPATRTHFVRDACGARASLYHEVAGLLCSHNEASTFIERPAVETAAGLLTDLINGLQPGEQLGTYTILSLIGSGGMGEVYLAEDTELNRKVALKLVKRGYGTAEIIQQFRREERILANLTHPNIARLYGGAMTPEGLPYFVMEYVEGERLDDYCEHNKLSLPQRLELFRKVCAPVSYAHRRLVIHRDLKPANIRVSADGEPKLLDFGIAKLLDTDAGAAFDAAMTSAPAMTPDYASPEQTRGEPMTTATDVYSLGVIFYRLLTGEKPYQITSRTPAALLRAIREQEPTRPSSAVRPGNDSRSDSSLRGDLDTIALMALRKEPARRYSSVDSFSDDIRRYLEGRPVIARKDTLTYRTEKFVQRNRLGVAAGLLLLLSMVIGIITTSWQAEVAREEKAEAQSVNTFLEDLISYSNPYLDSSRKNGRNATMSDLLDAAARRLTDPMLTLQPESRAELERIISTSYNGQGNQRLAEEHMRKYITLATRLYSPGDPRLIPALSASAYVLFSHGDLEAAEKAYREVLPRLRKAYAQGKFKVDDFVAALNNFGYLRRTQGDSGEAELLFRETIALSSKLPKNSHFVAGITRSTLASTLADEGHFQEALRTAQEAVEGEQQADRRDTPSYGFAQTILGGFLTDNEEFAKADEALSEGEQLFRRLLGPAHLWLGDNLRNQAISFYRQGRFTEAQIKVTEALRIYEESFGPHYDQYPTALMTKGLILDQTGNSIEGEAALREALKLRTDSLPKDHFWVALAERALGECLSRQPMRAAEAEPLLLHSCRTLTRKFGANDPRTKSARHQLVAYYDNNSHPDQADAWRNE